MEILDLISEDDQLRLKEIDAFMEWQKEYPWLDELFDMACRMKEEIVRSVGRDVVDKFLGKDG